MSYSHETHLGCGSKVKLCQYFTLRWSFMSSKVNFVRKNWFPWKTIHQFSVSEFKMLLLTGNIGKAYKAKKRFVTFSFTRSTKSSSFCQTHSLAHGQNSRMLITFFRSEFSRCTALIWCRVEKLPHSQSPAPKKNKLKIKADIIIERA